MPPAYVKPYVERDKTDAGNAEAICEADTRPTMRFVPIKSVEQQAALSPVTWPERSARAAAYTCSAPSSFAWGGHFDRDRCRASFEAKGRMARYLADIPLYLVTEQDCGLLGLSMLFDASESHHGRYPLERIEERGAVSLDSRRFCR